MKEPDLSRCLQHVCEYWCLNLRIMQFNCFNSRSRVRSPAHPVPLLNRDLILEMSLRANDDPRLPSTVTLHNQLAHLDRALRVKHRDRYAYYLSYPRL